MNKKFTNGQTQDGHVAMTIAPPTLWPVELKTRALHHTNQSVYHQTILHLIFFRKRKMTFSKVMHLFYYLGHTFLSEIS